jgi:multiple sugar transport system substrate-binding protein
MIANNDLLNKNGFSNLNSHLSPTKFKNICHTVSLNKNNTGTTSDYTWQDAQLAYGNSVFENSSVNLTSNKARAGFSLIEDLTNENGYQSVSSNQFDQGTVAFMPLSLAKYRTYTSYPYHVAHTSSFKWKVFQMPSITNVNATPASTVCLGVAAKTAHPTLSWEFIKLMCTDKEIQQEVIKNRMGSSVLPRVINSSFTKKIFQEEQQNTLTPKMLNAILENIVITPKFRNYDRRLDELNYLIQMR